MGADHVLGQAGRAGTALADAAPREPPGQRRDHGQWRNRPDRSVLLALAIVVLVGVLVRVPRIEAPPATYRPTRQYASALIARNWLATVDPGAVAATRSVTAATREPLIEPPVMEAASTVGFVLTGGQSWWVPRLLSTLLWAATALVVFALGRRLGGPTMGLIAAAVVMLDPATTEAARSFQPEALLLFVTASAALALVRLEVEAVGRRRTIAAGLWIGVAVAIKVNAALLLLPLAVLVVERIGRTPQGRRAVRTIVLLAAIPATLYYGYGLAVGGFLADQTGGRFLPSLWLDGAYWRGWIRMTGAVVPGWLVLAAIAGTVSAAPRVRRTIQGLGAGYVLLGLAFTWHISTHSYYSLPLLLPVALGAGAGGAWLLERAPATWAHRAGWACLALVALTGATQELTIARQAPSERQQPAILAAREVGDVLPDGATAAVLAPDYGSLAEYYGKLAARAWPYAFDLQYAALQGERPISTAARLTSLEHDGVRWFVVTDLAELDRQPQLRSALNKMPLLRSGPGWRIYRLRP